MKHPKIYYLIETLNDFEIKKIRIILKSYKSSKTLLELFNFILKDLASPQPLARNQLDGSIDKHFRVYCSKLYNIVLPALRVLHDNDDAERIVLSNFMDINILIERRLFDQAIDLILKTKKILDDNYLFYHNHSLLKFISVCMLKDYRNLPEYEPYFDLEEIAGKNDKITKYYRLRWEQASMNYAHYTQSMPSRIIKKDEHLKESVSRIEAQIEIEEDIILKIEQIRLAANYCLSNAKYEEAFYYTKLLVEAYEEKGNLTIEGIGAYWFSLTNAIQIIIRTRRYDYYDSIQQKIEYCISEFKGKIHHTDYIYKKFVSLCALISFNVTACNIEHAKTYIDLVDKEMDLCKSPDCIKIIPWLYYFISLYYFLTEDYQQSIDWNNKIFFVIENNTKNKFFHSAKVLELFIQSELGNHELLDSLIRSHQRGQWNTVKDKEIENDVFKLLRLNAKPKSVAKFKVCLLSVQQKLEQINYAHYYLEGIDLIAWVNAKLSGKLLRITLQEEFERIKNEK